MSCWTYENRTNISVVSILSYYSLSFFFSILVSVLNQSLKQLLLHISHPQFQLNYLLVHAEPRYSPTGTLPDVDQYPVLNATASSMFTANFLNDCGADAVCISDLVVDPKLLLPLSKCCNESNLNSVPIFVTFVLIFLMIPLRSVSHDQATIWICKLTVTAR